MGWVTYWLFTAFPSGCAYYFSNILDYSSHNYTKVHLKIKISGKHPNNESLKIALYRQLVSNAQ